MKIDIDQFDYDLPDSRIAKFPLPYRSDSKLLTYRDGTIGEARFHDLPSLLSPDSLLVFNNTKVIRARLVMHKPTGARIEIFCLEPHAPADYERAFAARGTCEWKCMVGNAKKWKEGAIEAAGLRAYRTESEGIVRFEWDGDLTFGQLLEELGRIPIPPYLNRESEASDNERYQTVYAKWEGSVAAPTAGLHFTPELLAGFETEEVTLHVGAGTFLPVKERDAALHTMHTEHFEITRSAIAHLLQRFGNIVAVGTTSVRTLESLPVLAWRVKNSRSLDTPVGQWEAYDLPGDFTGREALQVLVDHMEENHLDRIHASTRIMITPAGFRFRMVDALITNFHQPRSTLLLLVSAFVKGDWRRIYDYALANEFRFLSYGDSSLIFLT